jgi:hypothetical protein
MTQAEIDAWTDAYSKETTEKSAAEIEARGKVLIEKEDAAADARDKVFAAQIHHALNEERMKQCTQMTDTPAVDWDAVAKLRGITVSINDCVEASAELAAEGRIK